jgi:hypothetical protein
MKIYVVGRFLKSGNPDDFNDDFTYSIVNAENEDQARSIAGESVKAKVFEIDLSRPICLATVPAYDWSSPAENYG